MEVKSVLVTGANRGIGLEFVKQIVKFPEPPRFVFATYREENTTQVLKEIRDETKESQIVLIKIDITKKEEIESARKVIENNLGDSGLNLLINNAAALKRQSFPDITKQNMVFHFATNAVGPVMVLRETLPLLQKAASFKLRGLGVSRAAVINISSNVGSIGDTSDKIHPKKWLDMILGYKVSKAALNMAMRVIALTVKEQGILMVNMCPGWVKTDMGSEEAELTTEESISAMLQILPRLNESHNGTFLDTSGGAIPF